jgi:hypothetical protein
VCQWNVDRACFVGRLVQRSGSAPVVVHPAIHAGAYGSDEDADERAAGMESSIAVLDCVLRAGGEVLVLKRDDGTLSDGTRAEVAHVAARGREVVATGWSWIVRLADDYGLGDEARRLHARLVPS